MTDNTATKSLLSPVEKAGVSRRNLLKGVGAVGALTTLSACATIGSSARVDGRVVVIGGGFGGATAAKYIKRANPNVAVTLVEPNATFYTCPFSNLYLGGIREFEEIGHGYDELRNVYGVEVVHTLAEDIDPVAHRVQLANGTTLEYDKLVMSPGIDMRWNAIEGYDEAAAELAPHAWKAGAQTQILKRQLEAMPNGGLFVMVAPPNPYRCPPGPYERASMVAHYFKENKPDSKILILDPKDAFSKQGLFTDGWNQLYPGMIEWVGLSNDGRVVRVDAARREVETEFGTRHQASVLNVIPAQKAGWIADRAGVTDASGWVPVQARTFESQQVPDIYVIGDATVAAPMPKSGFCANSQAKVAAAAIVSALDGRSAPNPYFTNTCYSLIGPEYGVSVAAIYNLNTEGNIQAVAGAGGLSPSTGDASLRRAEAMNAHRWYDAICQDAWGTPS
ncbi:FCSD flavin-binding domain-containing protein [Salinispirillum marinum]|uniref:FCSD flavin-binding domain-containing protein n=2 Tax=Saccharospirillaceae TaxID=255527 RepID=A0ABV8BCW2_9GAMM